MYVFPTIVDDVNREILVLLDTESVKNIILVNKYLNNLCDSWFWHLKFNREYTILPDNIDYRQLYYRIARNGEKEFLFFGASYGIVKLIEYAINNMNICNLDNIDEIIRMSANISAKNGEVNIIKYFLENYDFDINYIEVAIISTRNNHIDIAKLLLDYFGQRLNAHILDSILETASANGNLEIVKLFNNDMYRQLYNNNTSLIAIEHEKIEIIKFLIDNDLIGDLDNALIRASMHGQVEIVKLLLDAGANIHTKSDSPLTEAVSKQHLNVIRLLLDNGANVHVHNNRPLITAATYGNCEILQLLLDRGANVHAFNGQALINASKYNHEDAVCLLIKNGANVYRNGGEALCKAVIKGNIDVVKILIDNKANLSYKDNKALISAATLGKLEIVKLLLDKGANIHAQNDKAIISACKSKNIDIARLLIDRGADINANNAELALIIAKQGNIDFMKLLISRGIKIDNKRKLLYAITMPYWLRDMQIFIESTY